MAPDGTILLTGANGTLGSHIVARIVGDADVARRYHGLYAVRKVETATTLREVLDKAAATATHAHAHDVVAVPLDRLAGVRAAAAAINARVAAGTLPRIRAVIWNAAVQEQATQTFTEDGYDVTFQANYLSHWLLTLLLLQSMDRERGRVVIVGSWTHECVPPNLASSYWLKLTASSADPRNRIGGPDYVSEARWKTVFAGAEALARGTYSAAQDDTTGRAGLRRYGASKLCEVMMIREMQARFDRDPALAQLSVLGVDPGGMATTLVRNSTSGGLYPAVMRLVIGPVAHLWAYVSPNGLLRPPGKSARDVLRAALATEPPPLSAHPKGLYFNGDAPAATGAEARDPAKGEALWRDSVRLAGLQAGETILAAWN